MPTITQTANANAVWNGTIVGSADPSITAFRLYAAQPTDDTNAFRFVKQVANPGAGPFALGPITYPELFLQYPTRTFYLRTTTIQNGKESPIAGEPSLSVTPSSTIGWSRGQLLEQEGRPMMLVGYDPSNDLYYPINVVEGPSGQFKLETSATATIAPGDIQIGAVEIKDHTNTDRQRVKPISGLAAGENAAAVYEAFNITQSSAAPGAGSNLDNSSGVNARHQGSVLFVRLAGATAIGLEIGIRDATRDYPIINNASFSGQSDSVLGLELDSASNLYVKTTGAAGADSFAVKFINKIYP